MEHDVNDQQHDDDHPTWERNGGNAEKQLFVDH
jgi:hypothetical protein